MIDLCKIFGVAEGEEFRFIRGAIGKTTYKLQDNQLLYYDENACKFVASALFINELNNIYEISLSQFFLITLYFII